MLIYNITFHIDDSIHRKAIDFIKNEYIPKALKSGILFNPRLCKIHAAHDDSGWSYSVQFYVKNQSLLNEWWSMEGEKLQNEITRHFSNKMLGFTTLLEEIDIDE